MTGRASDRVKRSSQRSFYLWVAVVLAVAVAAVILAWHSGGGTPDPTDPATHMSRTSAVVNSAVLVFREGLETILVLAAVLASFLGANTVYRRPVAIGGAIGVAATIGTWFAAVWIIGLFGGTGLSVQAATGHPGDHRPADRDELVLSPGLLDRLDLTPSQAPARPAERQRGRRDR